MMRHKQILLVFTCLMVLCIALQGCGKKGNPRPAATEEVFSWKEVTATMQANCIIIQAELEGNVSNVAHVILEVEPLSEKLCPECPFKPTESENYTAFSLGLSNSSPAFIETFCPAEIAIAYRWRLTGTNVFSALPYAVAPVKAVVSPE